MQDVKSCIREMFLRFWSDDKSSQKAAPVQRELSAHSALCFLSISLSLSVSFFYFPFVSSLPLKGRRRLKVQRKVKRFREIRDANFEIHQEKRISKKENKYLLYTVIIYLLGSKFFHLSRISNCFFLNGRIFSKKISQRNVLYHCMSKYVLYQYPPSKYSLYFLDTSFLSV